MSYDVAQNRPVIEVHRQGGAEDVKRGVKPVLPGDLENVNIDAEVGGHYLPSKGQKAGGTGTTTGGGDLKGKNISRELADDIKGRGENINLDLELAEDEDAAEQAKYVDEEEEVTTERGGSVVDYGFWEQTTFHLPAVIVCLIAYVFGLPGGAVVALIEKKSFYTSFHGFQAFMLNVFWLPFLVAALLGDLLLYSAFDVYFLSFIWLGIVSLVSIICAVMAAARAPDGKLFSLPLIGSVAKRLADKTFGP